MVNFKDSTEKSILDSLEDDIKGEHYLPSARPECFINL